MQLPKAQALSSWWSSFAKRFAITAAVVSVVALGSGLATAAYQQGCGNIAKKRVEATWPGAKCVKVITGCDSHFNDSAACEYHGKHYICYEKNCDEVTGAPN